MRVEVASEKSDFKGTRRLFHVFAAHPLSADDTELKITRSLDEVIYNGVWTLQ